MCMLVIGFQFLFYMEKCVITNVCQKLVDIILDTVKCQRDNVTESYNSLHFCSFPVVNKIAKFYQLFVAA